MSRQARVKLEQGWVHVMGRGLERQEIYQKIGVTSEQITNEIQKIGKERGQPPN